MEGIKNIKFDDKGLVTVVAQDFLTKEVLMVAYANKEALEKTLVSGKMHYFSRSRQSLWLKGETSGHFQELMGLSYDCDGDAILAFVKQTGVACHTGEKSCFYRHLKNIDTESYSEILKTIYDVIEQRDENPKEGSYTNYLLKKGIDKTLKKVGEETAEVIIGMKNNDKENSVYEVADLLYHLSVALYQSDITWEQVFEELSKRR